MSSKPNANSETAKKGDFAIVTKNDNIPRLSKYLQELKGCGLQYEIYQGETVNRTFVLIILPENVLKDYANVYNIEGIYNRSRRLSVRRKQKAIVKYSDAQRLFILSKILETSTFGDEPQDVGLTRLIKRNIVEKGYPLHDGFYNDDSNSGRNFLWENWARSNLQINIPLEKIQEYFGWEIAFYFAWLELFHKMLIPVAIVGFIVFLVSLIMQWILIRHVINDICDGNDVYLCPMCPSTSYKYCKFPPLSTYCFYAQWTNVFDNALTLIFAVLMSFWATVFLKLWRRKETYLKFLWQAEFIEIETDVRPEFHFRRHSDLRWNKISGKLEPWMPKHLDKIYLAVAVIICICLLVCTLGAYIGLIYYRSIVITVFRGESGNIQFFLMYTSSLLRVLMIFIFEFVYKKVTHCLTTFENPRTQAEFNRSELYKRFILSFTNNYCFLFYIAFIKGRFYETSIRGNPNFMLQDNCQPLTCIMPLCISLALLMILKRFKYFARFIIIHLKQLRRKSGERRPQYEEDYLLSAPKQNILLSSFYNDIIDYGFVTFFVAAFPLAPLVALINNYLEQRVNSYHLVVESKRPVPRKTVGIGEWNGILLGITYFSTITNACVMAFTSDFIAREIFRHDNSPDLKGFVHYTLTSLAVNDSAFKNLHSSLDVCYYKANRHPHSHPQKYQLNEEYWNILSMKLVLIFVFEHVIFICNALLAYVIKDTPHAVKELKLLDKFLTQQARLTKIDEKQMATIEKSLSVY